MNNLLIFGVGLIGGSIALESQKKQMFNQVIGVQREGGTSLSSFVSNGMINRVSVDLNEDIKQADFIAIATPVAQIQNIYIRYQILFKQITNSCGIYHKRETYHNLFAPSSQFESRKDPKLIIHKQQIVHPCRNKCLSMNKKFDDERELVIKILACSWHGMLLS